MGLNQRGRSRIWLDDRFWWIGVVEFQPSGFSKGSYLNVGCMWLWHVHSHIAYSQIERIESFHRYESEDQFKPIAMSFATQAKDAIEQYRKQFKEIQAVRRQYLEAPRQSFWQNFDAAVVCALCGDAATASKIFEELIHNDQTDFEWQVEARRDARYLGSLVNDFQQFQNVIASRIRQTRQLQKLPPVENIAF